MNLPTHEVSKKGLMLFQFAGGFSCLGMRMARAVFHGSGNFLVAHCLLITQGTSWFFVVGQVAEGGVGYFVQSWCRFLFEFDEEYRESGLSKKEFMPVLSASSVSNQVFSSLLGGSEVADADGKGLSFMESSSLLFGELSCISCLFSTLTSLPCPRRHQKSAHIRFVQS